MDPARHFASNLDEVSKEERSGGRIASVELASAFASRSLELNEALRSTDPADDVIELTVVIPCLNEADTLEDCLKKAQLGLQAAGAAGEIVVADNGSTD